MVAQRISSNGPDAQNSLFAFLQRGLRRLGAVVKRSPNDNLVVRIGPRARIPTSLPPWTGDVPPPSVEIAVQGLPNLLHEVGHLMVRRVLDHDHGIDYGAIPFDLGSSGGQAVLWEEIACCTLSCGYPAVPDDQDAQAWEDAWFREQVEIQPIFYGYDDGIEGGDGRDVEGFWNEVSALYEAHGEQAERAVEHAYAQTEILLRWAGAPAGVATPRERLSFGTLLRRARHSLT